MSGIGTTTTKNHAPWNIRRPAKQLMIDKIAHPAKKKPLATTYSNTIGNMKKMQFPFPSKYEHGRDNSNQGPMKAKPTLPNSNHFPWKIRIVIPVIKKNIECACADQHAKQAPEQ